MVGTSSTASHGRLSSRRVAQVARSASFTSLAAVTDAPTPTLGKLIHDQVWQLSTLVQPNDARVHVHHTTYAHASVQRAIRTVQDATHAHTRLLDSLYDPVQAQIDMCGVSTMPDRVATWGVVPCPCRSTSRSTSFEHCSTATKRTANTSVSIKTKHYGSK